MYSFVPFYHKLPGWVLLRLDNCMTISLSFFRYWGSGERFHPVFNVYQKYLFYIKHDQSFEEFKIFLNYVSWFVQSLKTWRSYNRTNKCRIEGKMRVTAGQNIFNTKNSPERRASIEKIIKKKISRITVLFLQINHSIIWCLDVGAVFLNIIYKQNNFFYQFSKTWNQNI